MEDNVINLHDNRADVEGALEILDSMEEMIKNGDMTAFSAVAIEPGGSLRMFIGRVLPCTRLEMAGAISALLHAYHNGEDTY